MANPGTSIYPGTIDAFSAPGTATYEDSTGYEHDLLHGQEQDAVEKIETAVGTTAGTNVLKDFAAGHFPARVNSGGTIVQTLIGGTITSVIINSSTIGTPAITGGTITSATLGTPLTDVISEKTSATGVTVDGLLIKDSTPIWDGWTIANETWAYASATTITVPAGAASKYGKGDKIKLTQTTVKYFYIVGVADTVLTVTGGTDYTVANAAISANYYSKIANPQGFPGFFNWTPTITYAAGTTDPTSNTISNARFRIDGTKVSAFIYSTLVRGTGNRAYTYFSMPVNFTYIAAGCGFISITGTDSAALVYLASNVLVVEATMSSDGIYKVETFYEMA